MSLAGGGELLVVADDLSGALETAAALGPGTRVALADGHGAVPGADVVDTDTRRRPEHVTAGLVQAAVQAAGDNGHLLRLIKIDSLLRGHISATLAALATPGRRIVVCPALPLLARSVHQGVVLVDGIPLHETDLWHVESAPAPASILDVLAPLSELGRRARTMTTADVAAGVLSRLLADDAEALVIPDAASQADVRAVVEAVTATGVAVDLVGGSELARQWSGRPGRAAPQVQTGARPQLFVLGSAARILRHQADAFADTASYVRVTTVDLLADPRHLARSVRARLHPDVPTVICLPEDIGGMSGPEVASWLAEVVSAVDDDRPDLFVCGGETARTVLDRIGVTVLSIVGECHPGAALAVETGGRLVSTRPGSHGDVNSLLTIHHAFRAARNPTGRDLPPNKE